MENTPPLSCLCGRQVMSKLVYNDLFVNATSTSSSIPATENTPSKKLSTEGCPLSNETVTYGTLGHCTTQGTCFKSAFNPGEDSPDIILFYRYIRKPHNSLPEINQIINHFFK